MNTQPDSNDTLIEGLARVVAVAGDQVWLAAEQPAACGACATRSACGSGTLKSAASWHVPRALGTGLAPLALGDSVRVGVDRSALTRATLTAYALPLFTMLVAALTVQGKSDGVAMVAALLGLLVGVACARLLARRWRDALMPVVLGRATGAVASTCAGSGALRSIAIPVIHQRSL